MKKKITLIFLLFSATLIFGQTEICGNGIDDDGDGYLDGYDPDCNSSPPVLCFAPASASTFGIQLNVQSPANTIDVSVAPTVGDIDGDGKVEIIAPLGDSSLGYIVYEVTGTTITLEPYQYRIPFHQPVSGTVSQPAIADINRDGVAEVICVGLDGHVYVFNHTGGTASVYRVRSNVPSDTNFGSPRVADINEDGRPEIIVGNDIFQFNAAYTTLTRVVQGNNANPIGHDFYSWGSDIVVIDILPGNPGKEIVAGSVVYGVNLATGALTILKNLSTIAGAGVVPANSDGPTAVADLDGDGDLDIVYSSRTTGRVYAWDPQNNLLLLNVPGNNINANNFSVSEPTIAYVYDDIANNGFTKDLPEIIITTASRVTAYNLQFPMANNRRVWQFVTTDGSGETGITAFDFNGDGVSELIYNDQTEIRIMNGNLAAPANLSSFVSGTLTWMEHPIVADVDGDGQAEMIAYSGLPDAASGQGRVNIFNPTAGNVWQPARKVWNQRGYHVVNINDDLTVPMKETSMTNFMPASSTRFKLLNQYNVQFNPNNLLLEPGTVPTPDAQINSLTYNGATNTYHFVIGVTGNANLPAATPITIYNGNPQATAATIVQTINTPSQIAPGSTLAFSVTATAFNANSSYYAVVNDNGSKPRPFNLATQFPSTGTSECNYVNNVKSIVWDSDGDGIANDIDLDDDNDGILDTVECPSTNVFANLTPATVTNGGAATATVSGIAFGNVTGTLVRALTGATVGVALAKTANDLSNASVFTPAGTTIQNVLTEAITNFNGTTNFARYSLTLSSPVESITLHILDWDFMRTRFTGNHTEQLVSGGSELVYNAVTRQLYDSDPSTFSTVTRDGYGSIKITSTNGLPLTQIVFEKFDDPNTASQPDGFRYTFSIEPSCDTDGDGVPNRLDLDSDADGCSDAIEGGADITVNELVTAAGSITGGSTAVNQNLCALATCVDINGIPQFSTLPAGYSNTGGQALGDSQNLLVNSCYCYKKPVLNAVVTVPTKHGITSLNRANSGATDWPTVRQSAWTVLEANTKGFVVNRVAFTDADANPATPMTPVGIAVANYIEGMMVYDTTNNCLKIYNGTVWNCYTTPACPQ